MFSTHTLRRRFLSIMLFSTLSVTVSACISQQPIFLNASQCSSLIPKAWKEHGISSAPLPVQDTQGALASFGAQQTGQLDKANDRTADTISIYEDCETLLKKVAEEIAPKPWWHFW